MSNGFMPKNVFKGRNSDGTTFRAEEWDFGTIATLELFQNFFLLVFLIALLPIGSIVLTAMLLLGSNYRFSFGYLFTGLLTGYVLYDFYHGWLGLLATSLIFNESIINYLVAINLGCFLINIFMLLFGWLRNESRDLVVFLVYIIFLFGCIFGYGKVTKNKGWVNYLTIEKPRIDQAREDEERWMREKRESEEK